MPDHEDAGVFSVKTASPEMINYVSLTRFQQEKLCAALALPEPDG